MLKGLFVCPGERRCPNMRSAELRGAVSFALAFVTSACDRLPGHPQFFVFFALRCAENRPLEVVVDGPRASGSYLVDYLCQHILLHLAPVVAPGGRVGGCCQYRSPVRDQLHRDGHRVCTGTMLAGVVRVDVPGAQVVSASRLLPRQHDDGSCVDSADGDSVRRDEPDGQQDLGGGTF
jgi:hypothetical protein